ncbi:carbohydrate ABC transporter membrane protein 2, CUT1 family [Lacrimispora sphenoides]|jgi:multiple sugar transport system permease protein|uniref:carbohydrate ABC transporter permease n=1 Tax=Lacrimispora sphenoides TaxID=29370 RepID=UPI0008BD0C71|nr:carbohydrate ABC transporter permease [Lacrimispora sphenoides]SEU23339.1 carbohydrate ABC transporter membrane protein 2, CUT1 family [Lacrimispora sphenoides]
MEKSHTVYSKKTKTLHLFIEVFLILVAALTLYPLIYIMFGSFKENAELLRGGTKLLPETFVLENYKQAWHKANFARYTLNSVVISVGVMLVTLLSSSMAGYVFARKNFKGKELLYSLFVAFMFVNVGSVTLRPLFELAVKVKMNTSLLSVILIAAGTGQATYIFLVRGYMNTISKELDDAAKIDGCTFFQIYYKVILPLLKPILATTGLLSFRAGWNEYIMPLVFTMSNEKMRPLTVGVTMLKNSGDGTAAWNLMFAGATISIIPIVIIYIFTSKQFMSGMTAGAVKG